MKLLIFISIISLISCCGETTEEKFFRECPYKKEYKIGAAHVLEVPIHITPHKLKYNVGDTIHISVNMSDTIYDINTEQKFKIQNFPFEPVALLYHFYDNIKWNDGFISSEYLVDAENFIRRDGNGSLPLALLLKYNSLKNNYSIDLKIVLKEKGRYIFHLHDLINDHRPDSDAYRKINSFSFDGKCPTFSFRTVQTIQGNDYMEHFEKELLHIDKTELVDNWYSNKTEYVWQNPYGNGAFCFERNATFGFIVE